MKALIIIILTLAALFWNAIDVFAMGEQPWKDSVRKENSHLPQPKPGQTCATVEDIGWTIEIEPYFEPDGQSAESNYQDYLGDLAWWFDEFPNACRFAPEPMPQ